MSKTNNEFYNKIKRRKVYFNNNNYFNFNTETLQNYVFLDLKELVAKRASNQLWGNGYVFKSDNKAIQAQIDIIENKINLLEFFYKAEKIHSSYGLAIFFLAVFNNGTTPYIELCMPYAQSRVSRINGEEIAAEVYFRYLLDDNSRLLKVSVDQEKIKYAEYDINKQKVSTSALLSRLPKQWNINTTTEPNPYNFIPIIFSQNLPKTVFWGDSNINGAYTDEEGVKGIKELTYKTFSTIWHELEFNKTRAFINMSQVQYQQLVSQINSGRLQLRDFIISMQGQSDPGNPFNLLVAQPQFDKYTILLDWAIKSYFKGCGYSSDADGSRTQTSMEINTIQSDDVETTRLKRNFRQKTYSRLFAKLLTMLLNNGTTVESSDFIFLIKENNILDKDKELLRIRELLAMNLTTRTQAIKEYYGLNDEQADKLNQDIIKQNTADREQLDEIFNQEEETEEQETETETQDEIKTTDSSVIKNNE